MTSSTIKMVAKTENTWQGQSGTMYDYEVTLEDGTKGIASSTSPENPPYTAGDKVEYTATTNKWGTKLKIRKESTFSGGGSWKQDPKRDELVTNSWAIKTAVAIMGNCGKDETFEEYLKTASLLARLLVHERDNLNSWTSSNS